MMFSSILGRIGFGRTKKGENIVPMEIDAISAQMREFNTAKIRMDEKMQMLESKTASLGEAVRNTNEIASENRHRLMNIEENIGKMVKISEQLLQASDKNGRNQHNNAVKR